MAGRTTQEPADEQVSLLATVAIQTAGLEYLQALMCITQFSGITPHAPVDRQHLARFWKQDSVGRIEESASCPVSQLSAIAQNRSGRRKI
ncbi:hypothetical protein D9M71_436260 [compost metagenome]